MQNTAIIYKSLTKNKMINKKIINLLKNQKSKMENSKLFIKIIIFITISVSVSYATGTDTTVPLCTDPAGQTIPVSVQSKYYRENDGTIFCWLDNRFNGSLFAQKIDLTGRLLWEKNGTMLDKELGTGFTADSDYPQMFSDNEGGCLIIYRKVFTSHEEIYAAKINKEGYAFRNPVCLSSKLSGFNYSPEAVLNNNNEISVVWENFRQGDFNIHLQKIDLDGNKLLNNGNEIIVCDNQYDQRKPNVACDQNNYIYVSWLDTRNSANNNEHAFDIYGNVLDNNGNYMDYETEGKFITGNEDINSHLREHNSSDNNGNKNTRKEIFYNHRIISSTYNSIIMVTENQTHYEDSYIKIIKLDNLLDHVWTTNIDAPSNQSNPLIIRNDIKNISIFWKDQRNNSEEVYSIRINENGVKEWGGQNGIKISCDEKDSYNLILPSVKNKNGICYYSNTAYLSWVTTQKNKLYLKELNLTDESRNCSNTFEIRDEIIDGEYTSITSQENNLVIVYLLSSNIFASVRDLSGNDFSGLNENIHTGNFPNPFNPSTEIQFSIPADGFVRLSVFDVTGRLIRELLNEFRIKGSYKQTFNGSDLPSGVYFYRLETNGYIRTKKMTLIK